MNEISKLPTSGSGFTPKPVWSLDNTVCLKTLFMNNTTKNAFLDAKNMLLLMRQLQRLDEERRSNTRLDELLTEVEKANGYSSKVPLVNQAAFLAMAYSTLVWLRESYFKCADVQATLEKRVAWIFDEPTLTVKLGKDAKVIDKDHPTELVRRVRNALGHASVEIKDQTFRFSDKNPSNKNDWACIEMSWETLGKLCEGVIFAGNDLLYPAESGRAKP